VKLVPALNEIPVFATVSCDAPQVKLILFELPAVIASVAELFIAGVLTLLNVTVDVVNNAWSLYDKTPAVDDIKAALLTLDNAVGIVNVYVVAIFGKVRFKTPTPAPVIMCVAACSDKPVIFPLDVIGINISIKVDDTVPRLTAATKNSTVLLILANLHNPEALIYTPCEALPSAVIYTYPVSAPRPPLYKSVPVKKAKAAPPVAVDVVVTRR
jgi:hypothetical protein